VEVGDAHPEALETGLGERRGRPSGRCGLLPLEQVDRAAVEAGRADEDPRVPARPVEAERVARLRLLRRGAYAFGEPTTLGVERARSRQIGAVDVDVEDARVVEHARSLSELRDASRELAAETLRERNRVAARNEDHGVDAELREPAHLVDHAVDIGRVAP